MMNIIEHDEFSNMRFHNNGAWGSPSIVLIAEELVPLGDGLRK
jgi:hypothetical protein